MTDRRPDEPEAGHEERVRSAFDELHGSVGSRLDDEARGSLAALQEAAARKDADRTRERLADVRERHGWLWEEMSKHPGIAALIDELALWGF